MGRMSAASCARDGGRPVTTSPDPPRAPSLTRLLLPIGRTRNIGHGDAVVDRLAADRLGLGLFFGGFEHLEDCLLYTSDAADE